MEAIETEHDTIKVMWDDSPPSAGEIDLFLRLKIRRVERMFRSQNIVDLVDAAMEAGVRDLEALGADALASYDSAADDLLAFTRQVLTELKDALIANGHHLPPDQR